MASLLSGRALRRHRKEAIISIHDHGQKGVGKQGEPPQVGVSKKKKKKELNDLPAALFFDILSRLPLTYLLLAARYTCKLWHSIINDPVFCELHLTEALKNPGYLYTLVGDSNLYFAEKPLGHTTVGMKLPGALDKNKFDAFVSCHGLMCYHAIEENSIYICNPIIGDHVEIPTRNFGYELTWGFGYAPLCKKYKYVQFSLQMQPMCRITAAILTLGDESWRELAVPFRVNRWRSPVYCKGVLYWTLAHLSCEDESEHDIVSFDLETEEVRARQVLPIGTRRNFIRRWGYTAVLGETVTFVICRMTGLQEVWTLMDEAEDIWVEKYRIYVPRPRLNNVRFTLLGLWMNQELYGKERTTKILSFQEMQGKRVNYKVTGMRFLSYNADGETYTVIQLPFAKDEEGISPQLVINHVGSLVSPSKIVAAAMKQQCMVTGGAPPKESAIQFDSETAN